MQFQLFGRVAGDVTGTNTAGVVVVVSLPLHCDSLIMKTIQIDAAAAELTANPVMVQGSITSIGNPQRGWFNLFTTAAGPGLFPIVIPDTLGLSTHEPNLNAIRLLSTAVQGTPAFPPSLIATFDAFWTGDCMWSVRNTPYGM